MIRDNKVTETAAESPGYRRQTPGTTAQRAPIHVPLHSPPQHPSATRPCSCVIVDPARQWACLKNALFLTWIFWGVGFNSATDNTPPFFLLLFQTPHAPSLTPSFQPSPPCSAHDPNASWVIVGLLPCGYKTQVRARPAYLAAN